MPSNVQNTKILNTNNYKYINSIDECNNTTILDFQENCVVITRKKCLTQEQDVALYLAVQEIMDSCVEDINVDIDVEKAKIEEAKAIIEESTLKIQELTLKIQEATRRSSIESTVNV